MDFLRKNQDILVWILPFWGFLLIRALFTDASFAGYESDAGGHAALINSARISFSNLLTWPLPYSGLILSHIITALFAKLTTLSTTKAMLVFSDLSLVIYITSMAWASKAFTRPLAGALTVVLALLLGLPGISGMNHHGFYPQVLAMAFYTASLACVMRERLWWALLWALVGSGLYPDGAIWIFPTVGLAHFVKGKRFWILVPCVLIAGFLFKKQLAIFSADGLAIDDWDLLAWVVSGLAVLIVWGAKGVRRSSFIPLALGWFIVIAGLVICHQIYGTAMYYPRKNLYSYIYWAPILAGIFWQQWGERNPVLSVSLLVLLVIGLYQALPQSYSASWDRILRSRGPITRADEECIRLVETHRAECGGHIYAASYLGGLNTDSLRILRSVYYNSRLGNYSPDGFVLNLGETRLSYFAYGKQQTIIQNRSLLGSSGERACWVAPDFVSSGLTSIATCSNRLGLFK